MRPEGICPSNSSMLARPSHTLRAVEVASNSYQESDPVRGSLSRLLWTLQLPIRKSKSFCPSRRSTRASSVATTDSAVAPPASSTIARTAPRLDITLPDHGAVMDHVAGHDVGEGPHTERIPARGSAPLPRLPRQVAEESETRGPDGAELLQVTRPGHRVGSRASRRDVLLVARQRALQAAGEPEGAERHQPLDVVQVPEHLAQAPLVLGVAEQGPLLVDRGEERARLLDLRPEHGHHVLAPDPVDVSEVVRVGLVLGGPSHGTRRSVDHAPNLGPEW